MGSRVVELLKERRYVDAYNKLINDVVTVLEDKSKVKLLLNECLEVSNFLLRNVEPVDKDVVKLYKIFTITNYLLCDILYSDVLSKNFKELYQQCINCLDEFNECLDILYMERNCVTPCILAVYKNPWIVNDILNKVNEVRKNVQKIFTDKHFEQYLEKINLAFEIINDYVNNIRSLQHRTF